jgi:tellurite resistance protein
VDLATRRQICRLVAGVLLSDEHFADAEKRFLQRIYARFELPPEECAEAEPIPVGAATAALRELPADVHGKVAALLVEAAIADGVIDPRERVYLLVAAAAMGLDAVEMEQRLAKRLETLAERGPMSLP